MRGACLREPDKKTGGRREQVETIQKEQSDSAGSRAQGVSRDESDSRMQESEDASAKAHLFNSSQERKRERERKG